ncbi:phosphoglycerate mutase family protein [Stylonychia lemnae]|uniref:Phosphoglycerate mutase family protein n=1 Tax=Stylonychia lemnae TaxID=5949 RepID=A0A078AJQ1_STYLE|nr:phosphoglycerate mutase family protein [Stylonychia lemnae]|eukprot:CDW81697.1 phosphoglycerate mutase family protein [Stylonychia lemnae]
MEVWLVRHGETFANIQKIIQGQQGGELTDNGIEQAKLVAQRLSSEQFNHIYCKFETDARLREKGGGILEGQPLVTFKKEAQKAKKNLREYKPVKGESWSDVMRRAQSFISEILSKHCNSTAAEEQKSTDITIKSKSKLSKSMINQEEEKKSSDFLQIKKISGGQIPSGKLLPSSTSLVSNKILVITHGGFIMEFLNAVRVMQSKSPIFNNNAKNTAIYVIKFKQELKKTSKGTILKVIPQVIVENDNRHLKGKD